MRTEREDHVDPNQPALIVTYGNTTRKHRPLTGELVVVGRSPCCDISLVSPEVAPIHCVIAKGTEGWRVRDCTGRSGTHVNGKSIQDEPLHDGDTLQVGTFSFQLNLPRSAAGKPRGAEQLAVTPVVPSAAAPSADNPVDAANVLHIKQSRERLARHALNLRRRVRDLQAAPPVAAVVPSHLAAELEKRQAAVEQHEQRLREWVNELTEQERTLGEEYRAMEQQRKQLQQFAEEALRRKHAELEQKVEGVLAERQAELEQRAESLQSRERDLECERQQLEEKMARSLDEYKEQLTAQTKLLQEKQADLDEQLKQVEALNAEMDAAREAQRLELADVDRYRAEAKMELEAQIREAEAYVEALTEQCTSPRRFKESSTGVKTGSEFTTQARVVDIRARELEAYAQHLRRTRSTLTRYEQDLSEAYQQFHTEYDTAVREAQAIKEAAVEEADAIRRRVSSYADTERMAAALTDETPSNTAADIRNEKLRIENERLRTDLTQLADAQRQRADRAETQVKTLKTDLMELRDDIRQRDELVEHLKAEVDERDELLRPKTLSGEFVLETPEFLQARVDKLKKDVGERDERIHELERSVKHLRELTDHREKQAYEAELNQYRVELEHDRVLVNDEIARLQVFRAEVEEVRQELELHISRERVEIAREWAEINRVREQLRRDYGKLDQTDSGLRERPSKAKLVKTEAATEPPPVVPPAPPPSQDLIARLRPSNKQGLGLPK